MTPDERLRETRKVLDEWERLAGEATEGPWVAVVSPFYIESVEAPHRAVSTDQWMRQEDRLHIVAHDPAAVLRRVEAGRLMCDEWEAHITTTQALHADWRMARENLPDSACRLFVAWSDSLLPDPTRGGTP